MNTIDKHSNYGYYILCNGAKKVEQSRLDKVIEMVRDHCKGKGHIRFMLCSTKEEPMAILYTDNKGTERLTKMITLSELETFLENN